MIAFLLMMFLFAPQPPDVVIEVQSGSETLRVGVNIETPKGALAARQSELLKDFQTQDDGSGLFDGLLPEGRLLRTEVVAASPHAEPLTKALFIALDTNKDGVLSPAEMNAATQVLLAAFDSDGDECLTPLELVPDLLTQLSPASANKPRIQFLLGADLPVEAKVALRTTESGETHVRERGLHLDFAIRLPLSRDRTVLPKSLLRPGRETDRKRYEAVLQEVVTMTIRPQPRGWFEALDDDGDGQISRRELAQAEKVLLGKAETITMPDFTSGKAISVNISPGTTTRAVVRLTKTLARTEGPEWFRSLDRNGDGDVSRREFPGTDQQFQKYDTNADGWISAAEALQIEATRKRN